MEYVYFGSWGIEGSMSSRSMMKELMGGEK